MEQPGYRIITIEPGKVQDRYPYVRPNPYASEPGARHAVALDPSHPASAVAIAELKQHGESIKTLLLILECAKSQITSGSGKQ
jgi:hypothetical protein